MYSKLRLFELKITKFKRNHLFSIELSKVFRGGKVLISGEI